MKRKPLFFMMIIVLISMACSFGSATSTPTKANPSATPNSSSNQTGGNPSKAFATQVKASGLIVQVIMAKGTSGDTKDPVNPSDVFGANDVIHAVVQIKDAPASTKFTAAWTVVDIGSAGTPGQSIDKTDLTTDGTRNLDFTLSPTSSWPTGTYKVDISVNDVLDTSVVYSVQ